jgi:hypothetical protein
MRLFPNRKYKSGTRWSTWRWTDIDPLNDGTIYLTRLHLVQTQWGSVMLHWINHPDPQDDPHDHPVSFLSIVLKGGYTEETGTKTRDVRFWNFIKSTDRHRIISIKGPTLTLVFAGPVVRGWGFWTAKGWVPWRQYTP